MLQTSGYFTLKRAAQVLGVHEQTLRAWERKGLIQLAHLPQSGYRRVPVAEVERLQTVMLANREPPSVRLQPPRTDAAALAHADELATLVRSELAGTETSMPFDEFMQQQRGRTWLP